MPYIACPGSGQEPKGGEVPFWFTTDNGVGFFPDETGGDKRQAIGYGFCQICGRMISVRHTLRIWNHKISARKVIRMTPDGDCVYESTEGVNDMEIADRVTDALSWIRQRRREDALRLFADNEQAHLELHGEPSRRVRRRARKTLLSLLTPEQRKEYRKRQEFTVHGSRQNCYLIKHGFSGNVRKLDFKGNEVSAYCCHPEMVLDGGDILPVEDAMIAQLLALTHNEDYFMLIANKHW